jgi:predicted ABC-type ATPase
VTHCPIFVNADLIAAGLSPFEPERAAFKAGRLMLEEIGNHAGHGESFAFETTLAGLTYAHMIPLWQQAGYVVKLIFLSLPDAVVHRRFAAGIRNFERYKLLVDGWQLYDNSASPPDLLDEGGKI